MSVLADTLVDRVTEIITRYSMWAPGDRIGVAVSGGADSVALLHILHRLSTQFVVLHVNHHLRGEESDADEAFVRSLGHETVVEHSIPGPGNLEEEARRGRRAFFLRARKELGLSSIALGHTRSDQAETVLFRLLRGSGLTGLAGMKYVTAEGLARPLLTTSRGEVREWLRAEGLVWREDSSNIDLAFTRNRLRNETLPELSRTYNPNLEGILAGLADLAQTEESYWNQEVESVYQQITKRNHLGSFFQIADLNRLHLALRRRLIRRAAGPLEFAQVEAILDLCRSEQGHDRVLVPGVDAVRSFDQLLLALPGAIGGQNRHYCLELRPGEKYELPFQAGFIRVDAFCANFKKEQDFEGEVSELDADALAGEELQVRNWQPGDQLHRTGHKKAEKVKELFQIYRVPLWERRHWPVVVAGEEIVWARQFGASARFRVSGKNRGVIRLAYQAIEPKGIGSAS